MTVEMKPIQRKNEHFQQSLIRVGGMASGEYHLLIEGHQGGPIDKG
jgi:hypothetical protein